MLLARRCAISGISQQRFAIEFVVFIHGQLRARARSSVRSSRSRVLKLLKATKGRSPNELRCVMQCHQAGLAGSWQKTQNAILRAFASNFASAGAPNGALRFFAWRTPLRCGVCCAKSAVCNERGNKQKRKRNLERAKGIEPSALAWEARVLPLYDARIPRL